MHDHDEKKRTEHNLFDAAVNMKRNLRSIECTDRHEASRSLFATRRETASCLINQIQNKIVYNSSYNRQAYDLAGAW